MKRSFPFHFFTESEIPGESKIIAYVSKCRTVRFCHHLFHILSQGVVHEQGFLNVSSEMVLGEGWVQIHFKKDRFGIGYDLGKGARGLYPSAEKFLFETFPNDQEFTLWCKISLDKPDFSC